MTAPAIFVNQRMLRSPTNCWILFWRRLMLSISA